MSAVDDRVSPGVMAEAVNIVRRDLATHQADSSDRTVLVSTLRQVSRYLQALGVPQSDCTVHAARIVGFVEMRATMADAPDLWMSVAS